MMSKYRMRWISVLITLWVACVDCCAAEQLTPISPADYKAVIKVACFGDSISAGFGIGKHHSYPTQLGRMLGEKWTIQNFGVSGATLLNKGAKPYQKLGAFNKAKGLNPDVVVVMLGTNDTGPRNWRHKADFEADDKDLLRQFSELSAKPRIYICLPVPVIGNRKYGCNEANILEEIPMLEKIARATKATVIDLHGALKGKENLIPDKVHPNAAGATVMAATVYEALTGVKPTDEVLKSGRGE